MFDFFFNGIVVTVMKRIGILKGEGDFVDGLREDGKRSVVKLFIIDLGEEFN